MKLSTISALYTVACGAGLALARSIEPQVTAESVNSTHEISELIDSLVWLDDDVSPYLGDKVPGDNFLSLCPGDHSGDIVSIDNVDLTPNPPVRGKELTVDATGTVKSLVSAGTKVSVKVKLGHSTVYRKHFDLCKEIEKIGVQCPIDSGTPKVVKSFTVPKSVPRALNELEDLNGIYSMIFTS
ncbi:Phosphatidylglycerol/phosphatidylinositol transfer protein [Gnomoniopsis smithogilvyi]|uniref:Phosphatidylglycerol/phosphatidylinositol transfer protein n=1 Tax=Gnomoniopsis smithogilvyi TaxID=1191159 RepID=A0A9W8YSQ1_9PEZI|nr:Phosphatidylglycerol/phosphatidylinositol transfer protein [Gnomoniopsis smithogilvyi]